MRFKKKPVVIDAIPCRDAIRAFSRDWSALPKWLADAYEKGGVVPTDKGIYLPTLEGSMLAAPDDWIICGIKGEVYPCKPDIFEETYEVEPPTIRQFDESKLMEAAKLAEVSISRVAPSNVKQHPVNQAVEDFKRDMLSGRLSQLTFDQRQFFNRLFPDGVPEDKLVSAIDLCDRTIKKNVAGRNMDAPPVM